MKPNKILMCSPDYFEVNYYGNEFMKDNIDNVNKSAAMEQCKALKKKNETLNFRFDLIEP